MNQLIHTPAGVRDIFGDEYKRKDKLMSNISDIFSTYGYQYIQTPSIEFYPVFDKDKGTMHESRLFRMIDGDGHTLVLRPDFTPSIARAVSSYFAEETLPIRLCYKGNVFLNNAKYRGRLNESTEMGVELINNDSVEADAELIAMSVDIMKSAGIRDFQISIGNVAYFNAIAEESGMSEEDMSYIRHLLGTRNQFGAIEYIEKLNIDHRSKIALTEIPTLFGNETILDKAARLTSNKDAIASVVRLKEVYEILKEYGCTQNVNFDFGMLSDYSYYTGIIFQAVTYGTGDAVIKGGRYNRFIEKFGKKADAIGFTTIVDSLMSAVERQKLSIEPPMDRTMILYTAEHAKNAVSIAVSKRAAGEKVMCVPFPVVGSIEAYIDNAKKNNCGKIIVLKGEDEQIIDLQKVED